MRLQPEHILVTGPMSSGTRLLCAVLDAGGLMPWHDKSHGTEHEPSNRQVVIVRHGPITIASMMGCYFEQPIDRATSIIGCSTLYPDALWLTYEQLCAAPKATVEVIARWLGIEPWALSFDVSDQNSKWSEGVGGPQIQTRTA